jgi:hypothetical protein
MVEGDEPKTVIVCLKYYLKNRLVHRDDSHMKYAWYAYTRYTIMLALEEKIWSMTIAERGSDDQPIRFGICIQGADTRVYERRNEREEGCRLQEEETVEKQFPLKTGRRCCCCNYELYWSSYDKDKLLFLQPRLTNDMVQSYVCDEAFKRMKQSIERGDVEKFEEKWSKMYGIRKAYWKHPQGLKYARRNGFPKEGYEAVVKKRF